MTLVDTSDSLDLKAHMLGMEQVLAMCAQPYRINDDPRVGSQGPFNVAIRNRRGHHVRPNLTMSLGSLHI